MLTPVTSKAFNRDIKRLAKRGKNLGKLKVLLDLLFEEKPLPLNCHDHALKGQWAGFRDLHIEPDWLLIYYIEGEELYLTRTGTHSELFDE